MRQRVSADQLNFGTPWTSRLEKWSPVLVVLWPFLVFFPRVFSFRNRILQTGNDFGPLFYEYKLHLLASLSQFRLPLWSPSEAAGFPFYSNPFAQAFYPLNIFLAAFYGVAGGYSLLDHQRFTIAGIAIFALGTFLWLRSLDLGLRPTLFATLTCSVSFKLAEIIRFPNAVHAAAWYPWILLSLTKLMSGERSEAHWRHAFLLAFSIVCLLTAGYPYYAYYSLFLIGPFVLLLLVPGLRRRLGWRGDGPNRRGLALALCGGLVAILACAPYLSKMSQLLAQTTDRTGASFEFATAHEFRFTDTVGSLVFPPAAQAEGWHFFGITGLLIVLLYFATGKSTVPDPAAKSAESIAVSDPWLKTVFLLWIGTIICITYGRRSPLFVLLWHHLPFFSRLRVWGRLNIVLVPIFAWLLAIAYSHFEKILKGERGGWPRTNRMSWLLGLLYGVVLAVQLILWSNRIYSTYWTAYFADFAGQEIVFLFLGALGFFALCGCVILARRSGGLRSGRSLWLVLAVLVLISAVELRHVGIRMWATPTFVPLRIHPDIARLDKESFHVPRTAEAATISNTAKFSVGIIENWYFQRYVDFLARTETERPAREQLLGQLDGKRLYLSRSARHRHIAAFLEDSRQFHGNAEVLTYTGDRLSVQARLSSQGYVSFIDNWDPDWRASVDGAAVPISLLFGTFKAVFVPAGLHLVEFRYRPSP